MAELPAEASEALDDACGRGLTPALFFPTAAGCVLSAWSGQERAEVVGLPSVWISRPDERLVGFLLDTLPLPFAPDRRHTLGHCYQALRDAYSEAADHARPAFDDVVDRLRLPRSARSPLIRLWFSDLTQAVTPAWFGDLYAIEHDLPPGWALFDLGFYLVAGARGVPAAPGEPARPVRRPHRGAVAAGRRRHPRRRRSGAVGTSCWRRRRSPALRPRRSRPHRPWTWSAGTPSDGPGRPWPTRRAGSTTTRWTPRWTRPPPSWSQARWSSCRPAGTAGSRSGCWPAGEPPRPGGAGRRRLAGLAPAARAETSGATRTCPWSGDGPATAVPGAPAPAAAPAADAGHVLFTSGTTGDPPRSVPAPVADTASPTSRPARDRAHGPGGDAQRGGPRPGPARPRPGAADRRHSLRAAPRHVHGPDRLTAWLRQERVSVLSATPALLALMLAADPAPLPDVRVVISGGSPLSRRPRRWSAGERPLLSWSTATAAPRRHSS